MQLVVLLLVAIFCCSLKAEVCEDRSSLLCHEHKSDCRQGIFKKYCCKTCSGPNPPTYSPNLTVPPYNGKCGKQLIQSSRVVSGTDAVPGSWPWQVLIFLYGKRSCGGSIVSPNYVVTAAHCVPREATPADYVIRIGDFDLDAIEGYEKNHYVEKLIKNPRYSRMTLGDDIALLKLKTPIVFNQWVQPVCLPFKPVAIGTECYVTGWGKTGHPGRPSKLLQQARLPVVANDVCEKFNQRFVPVPIRDKMICAGHGGATKSISCHGDSGGAFVCRTGRDNAWQLHGVVSWGSGKCDATETYPVFTRVSEYKAWLEYEMDHN